MEEEHLLSWQFPNLDLLPPGQDFIGIGADLESQTILTAYESGYFPMPVEEEIGWFSPDPRGVLFIKNFNKSHSLRKSMKKFQYSTNQNFREVIQNCADPKRPHGWIDEKIQTAYTKLHKNGWAHSIEVWQNKKLVGGLYGIGFDKFFAGESMFHHQTDASKAALCFLLEQLQEKHGIHFIDVQWLTPHLASLGCEELPREQYRTLLQSVLNRSTEKTRLLFE